MKKNGEKEIVRGRYARKRKIYKSRVQTRLERDAVIGFVIANILVRQQVHARRK